MTQAIIRPLEGFVEGRRFFLSDFVISLPRGTSWVWPWVGTCCFGELRVGLEVFPILTVVVVSAAGVD